MIRSPKGQTNALRPRFVDRPWVRDGPQGPPLRTGRRADPPPDLRGLAEAGRLASSRARAGGEAGRRSQLDPRRRAHAGGDGDPRAAAGPRHGGARSLRRRPGGASLPGADAQAGAGHRAAGRAQDDRAGAGRPRREERHRRGARAHGRDPRAPRGQAPPRGGGHGRGLGLPLRHRAGGAKQRRAPRPRRADGPVAREPLALAPGPGAAAALVRRPSSHPPRAPEARRPRRGGRRTQAPEGDRRGRDASALSGRKKQMSRLFAVEIVYRGIFQKKLAANISRAIVLAAHREGKPGISFGRYGLQPINKLLKPGGTLIVTSLKEAEQLIPHAHRKETPYQLAVLKGTPSFSGLWVYKDDHTDVRILGVMARVLPELFSLGSVQETIRDEWHSDLKATSALRAFERVSTVTVTSDQGNPQEPYKFDMPNWTEMREGIAIPAIPLGAQMKDPITGAEGGWQPARNTVFKKWATRTMRPVVDFEKCIKCTLCWLQCPDSCFDVTPEGLYDANLEACCGCGVCEAVCPVPACVTMVNEAQFTDNASQWEAWRTDKPAYEMHLAEWIKDRPERSHGFRYRGQYQEELPNEFARQG